MAKINLYIALCAFCFRVEGEYEYDQGELGDKESKMVDYHIHHALTP